MSGTRSAAHPEAKLGHTAADLAFIALSMCIAACYFCNLQKPFCSVDRPVVQIYTQASHDEMSVALQAQHVPCDGPVHRIGI